MSSMKVVIKNIAPLAIYHIIDSHNYLLMALDGTILRGLFEQERLKSANIRTSQENVFDLTQVKHVLKIDIKVDL